MKHLYKICLLLGAFSAFLIFTNASTGPGANFGTGYTGAPFDNNTFCSNCHGGGSFTPDVQITLLNGTTPVSTYVPNASYTLQVAVSSSTGVTPTTHYGFQVVGVRSSNSQNAGSWGSLSATDYHSVTINGRVYVEHNQPQQDGDMLIPWTAPGPGTGAVTFYAAGNVVNLDNTNQGDNPTTNTLTIAPNPLPATWLYFDGRVEGEAVHLEWATTSEMDKGIFLIEKSADGQKFSEMHRVPARSSETDKNVYTARDIKPGKENFYRLKHIGISGDESVFKVLPVRQKDRALGICYVQGSEIILQLSGEFSQAATLSLTGIDGRVISSRTVQLEQGRNRIALERPGTAGIYSVRLERGGKVLYADRVLVP